jgi:branched-chain amino acid aminotransferase
MADPETIVYFEGRFVPRREAMISAFSPAVMRGPVPYETLRAYWNETEAELFVFRLGDHLRRLGDSMRVLRFRQAPDRDELTAAITGLAQRGGFREDIHYRLFVYPLEQQRKRYATETAGVVIDAAPRPPKLVRALKCRLAAWRRGGDDNQPARVKAMGIRLFARAAMDQAIEEGYDELILLNERGKLAESVSSNLFLVRDRVAITPEGTASLLEGITRATLLELLREAGISTVEREVDLTELYAADEAFLCSTGMEITPIGSVDGLTIGSGEAPGSVTRALQAAYGDAIRGRDPRHRSWLTPVWRGVAD